MLILGVRVVELTVTGLPCLRAQWPGTSTGGKIIPAALQPRKHAGVWQAPATTCQRELGLVRPLRQQHGRTKVGVWLQCLTRRAWLRDGYPCVPRERVASSLT